MKSKGKISIIQRKETHNDSYLNWDPPLLVDQTEQKEKAIAI